MNNMNRMKLFGGVSRDFNLNESQGPDLAPSVPPEIEERVPSPRLQSSSALEYSSTSNTRRSRSASAVPLNFTSSHASDHDSSSEDSDAFPESPTRGRSRSARRRRNRWGFQPTIIPNSAALFLSAPSYHGEFVGGPSSSASRSSSPTASRSSSAQAAPLISSVSSPAIPPPVPVPHSSLSSSLAPPSVVSESATLVALVNHVIQQQARFEDQVNKVIDRLSSQVHCLSLEVGKQASTSQPSPSPSDHSERPVVTAVPPVAFTVSRTELHTGISSGCFYLVIRAFMDVFFENTKTSPSPSVRDFNLALDQYMLTCRELWTPGNSAVVPCPHQVLPSLPEFPSIPVSYVDILQTTNFPSWSAFSADSSNMELPSAAVMEPFITDMQAYKPNERPECVLSVLAEPFLAAYYCSRSAH